MIIYIMFMIIFVLTAFLVYLLIYHIKLFKEYKKILSAVNTNYKIMVKLYKDLSILEYRYKEKLKELNKKINEMDNRLQSK